MRRSAVVSPISVFALLCACAQTVSNERNAPVIGETQAPLLGNALWAWRYGGTDGNNDAAYGRSVAVDPSHNILLTGEFSGTADFGGQCPPLISAGGPRDADAYVAKFDASGACLWAHQYGDAYYGQYSKGVAVDASGSVFVVGHFRGTINFGFPCTDLQSIGASDIFVARLTPTGGCSWSQRFGLGDSQFGYAVAVDNAGADSAVVITGTSLGHVDFGGGPMGRADGLPPGYDTYVARFRASDGFYQMAYVYGTSGDVSGTSIAVDAQRRVVVAGYFDGEVNFGPTPSTALHSAGQEDTFIAKLYPDLSRQWSRRDGDSQPQLAFSVATDSALNVVAAGGFYGRLDFGGLAYPPLNGRTGMTIFLVTFDGTNGIARWAKQFGEDGDMSGASLAIGPSNSIFLTGPFRGSVDFGGTVLASAGDTSHKEIYLAKFGQDLRSFGAKQFGHPLDSFSESTCVDTDGRVLLAGSFRGSMNFDGLLITAQGYTDPFLSKEEHKCDGANCNGCCDNGNMCRAVSLSFCGRDGLQCVTCDSYRADSCVNGQCQCGPVLQCPTEKHCASGACRCNTGCEGSGGACLPGTQDSACGSGGQACVACGAYQTCVGGACQCQAGRCGADCHACTCADMNPDTPCGTPPHCHVCICDDPDWCNPEVQQCCR